MKHPTIRFFLILFLASAIGISVALENALSVEAKGLPSTLFSSSPPRGGGGGPSKPSPESKGEINPGSSGEDKPVHDPEAPSFSVEFPQGALSEPIKVKFFNTGLPVEVPTLANGAGKNFFFGAWMREEAGTVNQFNRSIFISTEYDDSDLTFSQEDRLRLYMYNPSLQAWVKLGGHVDIFNNLISGLTTELTPLEAGGNTLFALGIDDTPPLQQSIDLLGNTTLFFENGNFRFRVPPGTVEVGSYFEVSQLSNIPLAASEILLSAPISIQAYYINYQQLGNTQDRQITEFSKPVTVEFDYGINQLAQTDGSLSNLTIMGLRDGQWVDLEALGYPITRTEGHIAVDTPELGIFCLALK